MYDDIDYMRNDFAPCAPRFNQLSVQRKYLQCLSDIATDPHDDLDIPRSKSSFCNKFIPASYCFTNMIKDACNSNPNLDKFGEDYINAMKGPCNNKETS
ncbi:hypothetical protein NQ317_019331 [Molorchus minor]|uniref:T20D4.11-like domain-containing protein n=1 Tax=Molorchus minor TaxID=1323400 RepID=A0ABQ9ITP2_9CUCU|nr:hypothetical protein NQ317_019331 [Molorchus minor]